MEKGLAKKAAGKSKKAEMTSKQLVTIILLIVGFIIILFLIFQFSWGSRADKETCHQSVIFRATIPAIAQDYIPLKCRTEKVCITPSSFNTCEEYKGFKGVTTVKISSDKEKAITDIERTVTQQIFDCWSMVGEGRVSLFNQFLAQTYGFGNVYPTCVICSRIRLDTELLENIGLDADELKKVDITKYMTTRKVPGKEISYYEYFTGGSPSYIKIEDNNLFLPSGEDDNGNLQFSTSDDSSKIELTNLPESKADYEASNEIAVLFMQITAPEQGGSLRNIFVHYGFAWGGSFLINPMGTGKAFKDYAGILFKHPTIAAITAVAGISAQQGLVAWNRAATAGYCGDVTIGAEARGGCSVVRVVNYDENMISQYCSVIESIDN